MAPVEDAVLAQRGEAMGHMMATSATMEKNRRILNPEYTRQPLQESTAIHFFVKRVIEKQALQHATPLSTASAKGDSARCGDGQKD